METPKNYNIKKVLTKKERAEFVLRKLAEMSNTSSSPRHQRILLKRFGQVANAYGI